MNIKLTDDILEAMRQHPGKPVELVDEQTRTAYVLVEKDSFRRMVDEELRRQLQIGFDQADAGKVAEWNVEEILAEAHRRHNEAQSR